MDSKSINHSAVLAPDQATRRPQKPLTRVEMEVKALRPGQVIQIFALAAKGGSTRQIAEAMRTLPGTVSRILSRRSWEHIEPVPEEIEQAILDELIADTPVEEVGARHGLHPDSIRAHIEFLLMPPLQAAER
jgi:hypothetical protein